ncbi:hypothetical protein Igag_0040 [Ignisphaera aggregans DSM 17230]|uniref:Uncharacterized protein n=1 Tax=Ignisphaera aggregans (strain DSM 17230 / JCM 13409 / AQ1.S1) TaxID=583356 RepID=E0SPF0_IGNAA|nr:hypothetical protein Igag_0040 [Ignisphaera aggregans DSM 17230]
MNGIECVRDLILIALMRFPRGVTLQRKLLENIFLGY